MPEPHVASNEPTKTDAADPPVRAALVLLAMLSATTILSQFYRSSTAVIAPELIRDLSLTPEQLGLANASFFLALMAVQIPVGILFDRIGARVTVAILAMVSVVGAALHFVAEDGRGLTLARLLVGLGHGGSFMATIFLISRWWPRERWSTSMSWVFAISMLGVMLAGTPLALASEAIGWRRSFLVMAVVSGLVGLLFFLAVRDDPPGRNVRSRPAEGALTALSGFIAVLRLPGLLKIMALQAAAYAVMASIMGLWSGPYLHDVHGLDAVARGNVLIAMALAQTCGTLLYGPLDRLLNTRKRIAVAGALGTIALLAALAASPRPPTWLAIGLLIALCTVSAYGVVVVTHARSLYPEHLAGRGATTANIAQLFGCAAVPFATGHIPGLFPISATGYAPAAYQWIFAAIAASLTLGLAVYLTSRDIRPRPAAA